MAQRTLCALLISNRGVPFSRARCVERIVRKIHFGSRRFLPDAQNQARQLTYSSTLSQIYFYLRSRVEDSSSDGKQKRTSPRG